MNLIASSGIEIDERRSRKEEKQKIATMAVTEVRGFGGRLSALALDKRERR